MHEVRQWQVLHRLMDAVQFAPGDRQVAPRRRPTGEHDRVVRGDEDVDVDTGADSRVGAELGALRFHLPEPPLEVALLHLELGDPVAQQAADPVGALEHDHVVTRARELLGGGETGRSRADHRNPLARLDRRELGHDPPFVPRPIDDLDLDLLDRHRVGVDAEHAGGFARRRAQTSGELGEVVRGVQPVDRVAPMVAVHEVVPVGDQVAEWAPVVAERDAAIHAASGLDLQRLGREALVHLFPVAQANRHRPAGWCLPRPFDEPGGLTHGSTP